MEIKHTLEIYILAQGADSAPPLGTVLGNLGINSINFCKDFNVETADLPNYLTLSVKIFVFSNKSYKFIIQGLPFSPLLILISFERNTWAKGKKIIEKCVNLQNLVQLTKFSFPAFPLEKAFPIVLGTVRASHFTIIS